MHSEQKSSDIRILNFCCFHHLEHTRFTKHEKIKKKRIQKLQTVQKLRKFKNSEKKPKTLNFDFGPPKISKSKNIKINLVCFSSKSSVL